MVDVIANAIAPPNQVCDPRTGPQVGGKPKSHGALQEIPFQPRPALRAELRRSSRRGLGLQPFIAGLIVTRPPASDRAPINTELTCHLHRGPTFPEQRDGTHASLLEHFRTSGRAHGEPPDQSIGHYLSRNQ